jgi:transcriptional regulator GlxA family with amidase domain
MPRFTLTAFAGFVDALRLAGDEGDRSRQRRCRWEILGSAPVLSSCGASVAPTAPLGECRDFDIVVVVGGLLHGGQRAPADMLAFLRTCAEAGISVAGLCTGSFVLARAGLLSGYLACVSWFHREDFEREFPDCRVVSNQMFVIDRDRMTCAGGTSVVHLAAALIERSLDRASATKALRILIEDQPLPSRTLQPEAVVSRPARDRLVHRAMLALEQDLQEPSPVQAICDSLGVGRRQLERRFQRDIGVSPAAYRARLREERARWLLVNTDLEVTEIALECGFRDAGAFARAVRQWTGRSPSAIRTDGPEA